MEQAEMDTPYRKQLDVKIGDTIEVIAISTADDWHNQRHSLLYRHFLVTEKPKRARPHGNYDYRNWMSLRCRLIGIPNDKLHIPGNGEFNFAKIQFRIIKKQNKIGPLKMTARAKMLYRINIELNAPDLSSLPKNVVGAPQDRYNKVQWRRMYVAGYKLEARVANGNAVGGWYTPNITSFGGKTKREFRLGKEQ